MVKNRKKELEEYSGGFSTRDDAIQWYYEHGIWLENNLNRKLILVDNKRLKLKDYE
jgi:hypothetical protein